MSQSIQAMEEIELKYNINQQMQLLPSYLKLSHVLKVLEEEHQITREQFKRDRNLNFSNNEIIPPERLKAYADFFRVTPEQLKNFLE
jgi:hypothetical protein